MSCAKGLNSWPSRATPSISSHSGCGRFSTNATARASRYVLNEHSTERRYLQGELACFDRLDSARSSIAALLITAGPTVITSKELPLSKPEDVGLSSERLARMNKSIHEYVDAGRTPGVVTLIARHGKVVHVDAYGKADLASGRPTRADDIFRMYSMTKPITSVALLMLFEEGKFQLTRSAVALLPGLRRREGLRRQYAARRDAARFAQAADHHPGRVPPFGGLQLWLRQTRRSTRPIRTPTSSPRI